MQNMLKELPPIFEVKQENKAEVNEFLNLNKGLIGFLESIVPRLKEVVSKVFKISLSIIDRTVAYTEMLFLNVFVSSIDDYRKIIDFESSLYDTDNPDLVDIVLFSSEVLK